MSCVSLSGHVSARYLLCCKHFTLCIWFLVSVCTYMWGGLMRLGFIPKETDVQMHCVHTHYLSLSLSSLSLSLSPVSLSPLSLSLSPLSLSLSPLSLSLSLSLSLAAVCNQDNASEAQCIWPWNCAYCLLLFIITVQTVFSMSTFSLNISFYLAM